MYHGRSEIYGISKDTCRDAVTSTRERVPLSENISEYVTHQHEKHHYNESS